MKEGKRMTEKMFSCSKCGKEIAPLYDPQLVDRLREHVPCSGADDQAKGGSF
jgi:hypothetical protein